MKADEQDEGQVCGQWVRHCVKMKGLWNLHLCSNYSLETAVSGVLQVAENEGDIQSHSW